VPFMNRSASPPGKIRLRRVMRSTEYFTLAFGSIVGVGWMVVLEGWFQRGGPAGAMLGFLIAGTAIVPVVYVYGRLAERIPEAGSEVAYTGRVFPRSISFATGWALTLTYVMVCPWETVAMSKIAAHVVPEIKTIELYELGGYKVYLPGLLIGLATALAITFMNYRGVAHSAAFQNVTTFGLLGIFCIFAPLGLARGEVANFPPPFADHGEKWSVLWSIILVLQIVPYYLLGFETIPKCAEEAADDFAPRRFMPVMLLALGSATLFYVAIPGIVALLQPWQSLIEVPFATAVAFEKAFGSPWLVRLIMLGVVLSLLKVFNGNFLAATRLLYAMGSREMLGGPLGKVHARFQTPAPAILLVGGVTVATALLGETILNPITEVGSLTCVVGWLATCLSYCWGAAGRLTRLERAIGLTGAVVAGLFVVIAASGFGWYEWIVSAGWALCGAILWFTRRADVE
jgi:APA family basic amino acid/polyamine antiporter